jgi:hypothetical protein
VSPASRRPDPLVGGPAKWSLEERFPSVQSYAGVMTAIDAASAPSIMRAS